jgi:hypothetical protein
VLAGRRDHASPDSLVVESLPTREQELLRVGRLDNDRPGMVWLLAISVPVACGHTESRSVSNATRIAVTSSQGSLLENDGRRVFLPDAM